MTVVSMKDLWKEFYKEYEYDDLDNILIEPEDEERFNLGVMIRDMLKYIESLEERIQNLENK